MAEAAEAARTTMWYNDYCECSLDIKPGWELFFGPASKVEFPHEDGEYKCRVSKKYSGVDICRDSDFLTNRRLLVFDDDPVEFWLTKQHYFCHLGDPIEGCICPGFQGHAFRDVDYYGEEEEDEEYYESSDSGLEEEPGNNGIQPNVDILKQKKIPKYKCMYLETPHPSEFLKLEPVIDGQVYCLKSYRGLTEGYVFTVGISSACLDRFHSDEGYYDIAVHVYDKGLVLLGNQNELNWQWKYSRRYSVFKMKRD